MGSPGRPRKYSIERQIYFVWYAMRDRCTNPQNAAYGNYGGRGIQVCDRWLNNPEAFAHDMGPKPTPGHSIDRRNNDGHYEPGNCRWATPTEQAKNKRRPRCVPRIRLTFGGQTRSLIDWAKMCGISVDAMRMRIKNGWALDQALSQRSTRETHAYVYCRGKKKPSVNMVA